MALNTTTLQGRIAFDFEVKGTEANPVVSFMLSVARNYKPEGEQYYPEDLIQCKLFGTRANNFANFFEKGSNLIVTGALQKDDDYVKDGETVRGGLFVKVDNFYFQNGNPKKEGSSAPTPKAGATAPAPAPKKAAPAPGPKAAPKINAKPKMNF